MLNKFYKIIHNKYSKFFRFIFFLRYLFTIFFISTILFLFIPNFFNYEKKAIFVKKNLIEDYNFKIDRFEKIEFQSLPSPRLKFKNVLINLNNSKLQLNIKNLVIYPKLLSIYNYEKFQTKKIFLKDNNISLQLSDLKFFTKQIFSQKNKLIFDNLNLQVEDNNKLIFTLKNIRFSNYGYQKDLITGEIFGKKFKTKINGNKKDIKFKLLNSGVSADINFETNQKSDSIIGNFKSKILNTNLKFDFDFDYKSMKIYNSFFRSKNLSLKNNNLIIVDPYLNIISKFKIEEINPKIFKSINFYRLLEYKSFLKKINSKNEIIFKSKKFSQNLIDELNLKIEFVYGTISYNKRFSIQDNIFQCEGILNTLEEYPLLFFDCKIDSDKKKILKVFSINTKEKNKIIKINAKGSLNILNNKINFKDISINEDYTATEEDLRYYKESFERIVIDKSILEMFNLRKMKEFILEVS
tara:strand:+ start:737 stop:2137 length:1401 start_codon:yes stop_codon:yes gene_type:complete